MRVGGQHQPTGQGHAALPVAFRKQTITDTDLPCPGPQAPRPPTWAQCGSGEETEGQSKAQPARAPPLMTPALHSTYDWRWGKVSGSTPGKSINLNPLPRGWACGRTQHGLRSSQPGPLFSVTPSCATLCRAQIRAGRKGGLGGSRRACECRVVRKVVLGTFGSLGVTRISHA